MEMPTEIKLFLEKRQKGIQSPCDVCSSTCCNGPGFAIIENVLQIFDLYTKGQLARDDFDFEVGLNLSQFIMKYFDRTTLNNRLMAFFPKMISENNRLLSIPPWNFWEARDYIVKRETSYGCIFLERKRTGINDFNNRCILHNTEINDIVTQKPIDCLFLYCNLPSNIIKPTETESALWFSLVDYYFSGSIQKFNQLCPDLVGTP
jgi:hypothetical protein